MGYSQDHPAIPSSSNGSSAPFSPNSHGSYLQSSRRHSPVPDEPSSLPLSILSGADWFFLPTRAPSESDRNSCSDSFLSKHSFSEDLNNFPPISAFISDSRPDSPDSGSLNYNEPFSPSLPGVENCNCTVCTRGSKLRLGSGPDQNSCTDSFIPKHSLSEGSNNSARIIPASCSNTLDNGSLDYNQPSSSEHLNTSARRLGGTPLPTRASMLGSASEIDHKSDFDPSLPKYSRSEDLNHSAPSPAFLSASRPNTPGSSSHDRTQPSLSEDLNTSARRLSGTSASSHLTSFSPAENRPAPPVTSASSVTPPS